MSSEEPAFESSGETISGRDRGIGMSEDTQMPEREPGNPLAGGGFLALADDDPRDETSLPASEGEALLRDRAREKEAE